MSAILNRLKNLDSCAISDALDKLGIADRVVCGLAQVSTPRRVAGRVVTCRLVLAADAPHHSGTPRHLGTSAIGMAEPGDVIVVEQSTGVDAGCWGGILSLGARLKGVDGVIADGPVRDVDEARAYGLAVYCRSTTARTARGRVAELMTGGTVRIGGVPVEHGDYVVADASAVVFIPAAFIGAVLDVAESISAREAAMARALMAGAPVGEVMGATYENMLHNETTQNER